MFLERLRSPCDGFTRSSERRSFDGREGRCLSGRPWWPRELKNISAAESFLRGNVGRAQARSAPRLNIRARYLVDPASSHMLVSKIKPCMSQYKLLHGEIANGSLKQLSFIWLLFIIWITMVILKLIHAPRPDSVEGLCLLDTEPT